MRIWWVVLVLGACGSSSKPAPASSPPVANVAAKPATPATPEPPRFAPALCDDGDQACALTQATGFATEMCKCTDKPCADKVMALYADWASGMARGTTPFEPPFVQQMRKFTDCAKHAMYPGADPDP
jgi:hypothetical protein